MPSVIVNVDGTMQVYTCVVLFACALSQERQRVWEGLIMRSVFASFTQVNLPVGDASAGHLVIVAAMGSFVGIFLQKGCDGMGHKDDVRMDNSIEMAY